MIDGTGRRTPAHLWLAGLVSLLWNAFGCYDYLMSQTANLAYMRAMTEPFGADAQSAVDYFAGWPVWADAAWACGVWGALAGSVLLLLRSRFAFHAFALSLAGIVAAQVYGFSHPLEGVSNSPFAMAMTGAIVVVTVLLLVYARRQTANGVLR